MFSEGAQITTAEQMGGIGSVVFLPPVAPTLQSLFGRQPIEKFEAGTAILWEGDAASHIFEVAEGVLRTFRILSDGRRVITGFLYPGDILGVSLKDRYLYSAEAVTRAQVRRFARSRFQEEINRSPELRPQLFSRLCDEMAAAQDQMVLLARKNAEERVCSFLLYTARRTNSDRQPTPVIEIAMTRLDMADYLGLTIETVSRTMSKLMSAGVIAPTSRHGLKILKFEKLVALAGDGYEEDKAGYAKQAVWPN
jgi:CRP/FNR family transcriptional regulator, anaerobic regulatory protein